MIRRSVTYFAKPGPANTDAVIQTVAAYLSEKAPTVPVVVASITGRTALGLREGIADSSVPIVCVTGPPCWQVYPDREYPLISEEMRRKLKKTGISIVDSVPSCLSDTMEFSYARYGFRSPTWILVETLLAIGGYGLKTAVECILMATDAGLLPPFTEVVSIAGTERGADAAIVARSSFSSTVFSSDPGKRFVVHEILAMPREKTYYKTHVVGEWHVDEAKPDKR
jgi:hypothetical protein